MKIGILGDIHSNLDALQAAVEALRRENVDAWVQVGDIVGYGPEPSACIDLVRELGCVTCLGNHDAAVLGPRRMERLLAPASQAQPQVPPPGPPSRPAPSATAGRRAPP